MEAQIAADAWPEATDLPRRSCSRLGGVEHANFFETRATKYLKGATRSDWNTVCADFDSRKKVKANDELVVDDGSEPGLFGDVAAE